MGDVDDTVDIVAEPDETPVGYLSIILTFLQTYGWYIIAASLAVYFYFKNRLPNGASANNSGSQSKSPEELQEWQSKEEQRLKAVQRLQEKYSQDAAVKAERQKELDEEKRKAKLKEKEKLAGKVDLGHRVGEGDEVQNNSLRPEYNPLMGDQGSSGRVCFRRPGGGAGG